MKNVIKRIIVTILALILIFSFAACESEPFTCSICGDEKTGKYYESEMMGEEVTICEDCFNQMREEFGTN